MAWPASGWNPLSSTVSVAHGLVCNGYVDTGRQRVRDAAVHGPVPYSRCRTTGERAVEPPRDLEAGTLDCSEVSIADPGVEAEVGTKLCARTSRERF